MIIKSRLTEIQFHAALQFFKTMYPLLPTVGADRAHCPACGTPLVPGLSHDDVSFEKRELGRGRIWKWPRGPGRKDGMVFWSLCCVQGSCQCYCLSSSQGTACILTGGDRRPPGWQTCLSHRARCGGPQQGHEAVLAQDCSAVRMEGKAGRGSEVWATLNLGCSLTGVVVASS